MMKALTDRMYIHETNVFMLEMREKEKNKERERERERRSFPSSQPK